MRFRSVNSLLNSSILFGFEASVFILSYAHKMIGVFLFFKWEITNFFDFSEREGEKMECR
jgi:hypothetical protein